VDASVHPRIEGADRTTVHSQAPRDLDFEFGNRLVRFVRNADKHVARQQSHGDPVRAVDQRGIINIETGRGGGG
jgi:hypothetical protein